MKVTVRCYFIPADVTFDTDDVIEEVIPRHHDKSVMIHFKSENAFFNSVCVDRQHYEEQKKQLG